MKFQFAIEGLILPGLSLEFVGTKRVYDVMTL